MRRRFFGAAGAFGSVLVLVAACGEERQFREPPAESGGAGAGGAGASGGSGARGGAGAEAGASNEPSAGTDSGSGGRTGGSAGASGRSSTAGAGDAGEDGGGRAGEGGTRPECEPTDGWSPTAQECFRCSNPRSCGDADGETGVQLATAETNGRSCLCETRDGFFPSDDGTSTEECDADGDGWVNEGAEQAVESDNFVVRVNARCSVHFVKRIELVNETGDAFRVPTSEDDFVTLFPGSDDWDLPVPAGLPLYESARNDGAGDALPVYGTPQRGRRLLARELNGLTRACLDPDVDANDNGVADVRESPESPLDDAPTAALSRYRAKYRDYSYFVELFDGSFDADDGVYTIRERSRADYSVPIRYADGSDHPRTCARHPDALYTWSDGELTAPNTTGADFVRFGDDSGVGHPSQFKCVHVVTAEEYGSATAVTRPELVTVEGSGAGYRLARGGASHPWTTNGCYALTARPARRDNPSHPALECEPDLEPPAPGSVRWAAVGYEPYPNDQPYVGVGQAGGYQRGCVNECAGTAAAAECYRCTPDANGRADVQPEPLHTGCGTGRSCNGSGACLNADGTACSAAGECATAVCTSFYYDADGDDFAGTLARFCGTTAPSGQYTTVNNDCCDSDDAVYPGNSVPGLAIDTSCPGPRYDRDCDTFETPAEVLTPTYCWWSDGPPTCGNIGFYQCQFPCSDPSCSTSGDARQTCY